MGRPLGSQNKYSAEVKQLIFQAVADNAHLLAGWLRDVGREDPDRAVYYMIRLGSLFVPSANKMKDVEMKYISYMPKVDVLQHDMMPEQPEPAAPEPAENPAGEPGMPPPPRVYPDGESEYRALIEKVRGGRFDKQGLPLCLLVLDDKWPLLKAWFREQMAIDGYGDCIEFIEEEWNDKAPRSLSAAASSGAAALNRAARRQKEREAKSAYEELVRQSRLA